MESLAVADRTNMAFAGATITSGRAMGSVAATGMALIFQFRHGHVRVLIPPLPSF